jgi:hypothetical protein
MITTTLRCLASVALVLTVAAGCTSKVAALPEPVHPELAPIVQASAVVEPSTVVQPSAVAAVAVDFSNARQLYCNGGCSWAGGDGCDQADADVFCKLKTGNPRAYAASFAKRTALAEGGFACPMPGTSYGRSLGARSDFGVPDVRFQETSILENHGPGDVVTDVVCSTAAAVAR